MGWGAGTSSSEQSPAPSRQKKCSFWSFLLKGVGVKFDDKIILRRHGGWNDRAIFIETESRALHPDQKRPLSDIIKSVDKAMPKCFALCSIRTPISLWSKEIYQVPPSRSSCEGLFRVPSQVHPLLLIGPLAKLLNRLKEELTCLYHNSSNLAAVNFRSCPQIDTSILLREHKCWSISHHLVCGPTSGIVLMMACRFLTFSPHTVEKLL